MKTTMEFPDLLFRQAKAVAAVQGISLRDLLTQALAEKLRFEGKASRATAPTGLANHMTAT